MEARLMKECLLSGSWIDEKKVAYMGAGLAEQFFVNRKMN